MMNASEIKVITAMNKIENLKHALSKINGVTGMTVTQVIGCGIQKGTREYELSENVEMELLPKQEVMIVVSNDILDSVIDVIKKELYTGHIGDGKIFVSPISNIIRIRTGEDGMEGL